MRGAGYGWVGDCSARPCMSSRQVARRTAQPGLAGFGKDRPGGCPVTPFHWQPLATQIAAKIQHGLQVVPMCQIAMRIEYWIARLAFIGSRRGAIRRLAQLLGLLLGMRD